MNARRRAPVIAIAANLFACNAILGIQELGDDASVSASGSTGTAMNDGGNANCPSGRGPTMVALDAVGGPHFCIDSTEVTRAEYKAFLDTGPSTSNQWPTCAWNTTFLPDAGSIDFSDDNAPMIEVDWCDALAFCTWAGKRLCGSIADGGAIAFGDAPDPAKSEWMVACTKNGSRPYPYGQMPHVDTCNDMGTKTSHVGSFPNCNGGYDGIFDMAGNVSELENACDSLSSDGGGICAAAGGSYLSAPASCALADSTAATDKLATVGFRCCASEK